MQMKYEIDKKGIGRRLQERRKKSGFTQESLSEAMGITSKYVSKVENGAVAPSLPFVISFSEITGSDLNYLLRGIESKGGSSSFDGIIREPSPVYYDSSGNLSKKGNKIIGEMIQKLQEVLEENKI